MNGFNTIVIPQTLVRAYVIYDRLKLIIITGRSLILYGYISMSQKGKKWIRWLRTILRWVYLVVLDLWT